MADQDSQHVVNRSGGLVGCGIVLILAFVTWALIFREMPKGNESAFLVLVGIISNSVGNIISFYFGSSVMTKRQSETIDKQAQTIQAAQSALAPLPDATTVPVAPGESVTVKAQDAAP